MKLAVAVVDQGSYLFTFDKVQANDQNLFKPTLNVCTMPLFAISTKSVMMRDG